jgi:head-tail adaptor
MRSGELDRHIDLLARGGAQSATGAVDGDWTPYATGVWAKKKDLANDEGRESDQTVATRRAEFRIYFRDDLSVAHRVRYPSGPNGLQYEITGLEEVGRREGLLITAHAEVKP